MASGRPTKPRASRYVLLDQHIQDAKVHYNTTVGHIFADADEFIKLVARGLNRYNIIKRDNMYTIKEHNYTVNGKRKQLSEYTVKI